MKASKLKQIIQEEIRKLLTYNESKDLKKESGKSNSGFSLISKGGWWSHV